MILFMVYATALATLLGVAASRLEAASRSRGVPGRWAWAASMGASVAVAAWALLRPAPPQAQPPGAWTEMPVTVLSEWTSVAAPAAPLLQRADGVAAFLWAAATLTLALALIGGLFRLSRRARRWAPARVAGGVVLVSEDFGPAVMGVRSPRVVLPRWALSLEPERLRLVVLHEEEHQRAGDVTLLLAGTAAVVLAPWNPALWWQLLRLRAAVEVDCDARVLRRGAPPALYGRLLLDLGIQGPGIPLPVAALSKPPSLLERRLTMIVRGEKRGSAGRAAGAVLVAASLVAVACETPMPTGIRPTEEAAGNQEAVVVPDVTLEARNLLVRTAEGAGEPLYVVDGKRVDGIAGIDPEDIVRVEVVKGAAASTAYGPEGINGVVHVLTKEAPPEMVAKMEAAERMRSQVREVPEAGAVGTPRLTQVVETAEARIFLDGEPFEGDLKSIDKETIDRVEVVKGKDGERPSIYITLKR